MIIDDETFTEVVVRIKLCSDAVLSLAQRLSALGGTCPPGREHEWEQVIASMMSLNAEVGKAAGLLGALFQANKEEKGISNEGEGNAQKH